MRGYATPYICKCGGRVRLTDLESHYLCNECNEDYGTASSKRLEKLKKIEKR